MTKNQKLHKTNFRYTPKDPSYQFLGQLDHFARRRPNISTKKNHEIPAVKGKKAVFSPSFCHLKAKKVYEIQKFDIYIYI